MQRYTSTKRDFRRDENGNFAIMFSLIVGVMILGVAVAIEITTATNIKAKLASSVDMAVLTAAVSDEKNRKKIARSSFEANYALETDQTLESFELTTPSADRVRVEAVLKYKSAFSKILGRDSINISASAVSTLPQLNSLDVALVLDRTGSMAGANLSNLKTAATNFLSDVEDKNGDVRVSVVPFADYVNIGLDYAGEAWLDLPISNASGSNAQCSMQDASNSTCFDPNFPPVNCQTGMTTQVTDNGTTQTTTITTITDNNDGSCTVDTRIVEVSPAGVSDTTQTTTTSGPSSQVSTNWGHVTQTVSGNYCTYSPDPSEDSGNEVEECSVDHIVGNWYGCVGSRSAGNNIKAAYDGMKIPPAMELTCGQPISPLSSNIESATNRVLDLTASGSTYIPAGLMWGWRSLDPAQPLESDVDEDRNKLIILMTDGQNTVSQSGSFHSGGDHLKANALTDELCTEIKKTDIKIATVSYSKGSRDSATTQLLKNCASSSELYFEPKNAKTLTKAFEDAIKSAEFVRLVN